MPRSSLLNALKRIAANVDRAQRPARPAGWGPKIERRAALRGAASLAGMALLPRLPALAAAEARVAIVGAGLAGLTAAHDLSNAGLRPVIYEGSTWLGGRCLSIKFPDGQIAEGGGEFINSDHDAIMRLAFELGLEFDDTYDEREETACDGSRYLSDELWSFDGEVYTHKQANEDWSQLHPKIKKQFHEIGGDNCCYKDPTPSALELDGMSLAVWLDTYVLPGGRASKLGQLIENALSEELAADATALSGLVPAQQFWRNGDKFQLYDLLSDERYHIRGGNDQIPHLLGVKLGDAVQTGTALTAISQCENGKVKLCLTRDSKVFDGLYDRVILALPFTKLREVDIDGAHFQARKIQAIKTLGMGASTKFQLRFKNREAWHKVCSSGAIRLKSNLFQTTWDVTSARRHDRGPGGILCFWSGGSQAVNVGHRDCDELAKICLTEAETLLRPLSDGTRLSDLWTGEMTRDAWLSTTKPWSLGSYAYLPIGYATTLFGIEKEHEGNCFFAGEHTADKAVECGYLNAAVKTGQRAAQEVIKSLTHWPKPESNCLPRYRCEPPLQ